MGPCLGDPRHLGKHLDCSPVLSPYPIAVSLIQQLLAIAEPWLELQEPNSSQGSANPLGPVLPLQHSNGAASLAMARKLEHKKLTK